MALVVSPEVEGAAINTCCNSNINTTMGPHGKPVGKFHKRKKGDTYQGKNFDHSKKYGVKKRPIEQYNEELQSLQERYNEVNMGYSLHYSSIGY